MEVLGYGVCRLSVVAVRQAPEHQAPLVTQLLFGDHYEVLNVPDQKYWIYIRMHFDKMEGWIDATQHHGITQEYFEQINHANFKITTDLTCNILYKKSPLTILIGSIVPISNSELFKMEEQFAFNGEAKSLGQKREVEFLKTIAMKYLNAPALAGGRTPFGIDGSGLVQMVYKITGYTLPRQAKQLLQAGEEVPWQEAQPGDIVLWTDDTVELQAGILLDDHKLIIVNGQVRIDPLEERITINPDSQPKVKRILNPQSRNLITT
ncbi:MAG: C40 family peptidase [Cyclobacteriaceae bacterium]|jgi:gamma-D-glutamyl-L-lysine dipeptidyl-peptidase|nr:C40 family peptidase [Cyclobacteriaceae bacterium]